MCSNLKKSITLLTLILAFLSCRNNENRSYTHLSGKVFGTYYNIIYFDEKSRDFKDDITEVFETFDRSLSTFNPNSIISKINRNESVEVDSFFTNMYNTATYVSKSTNGAFDITVAPLVNSWGFGTAKHKLKDSLPPVNEILKYVGYEKISLKNGKIQKKNSNITLDASAIAKGQSCDVIAEFLTKREVVNYMIEIGGEVVCKGVNSKGEMWHIGIDKPYDDPANELNELQEIVELNNRAMATSGNYRQFYYKNGKRLAHTIDPRTGYPVEHNLLSATVFASKCITADAFATAFMVIGVDSAINICNSNPDLDCILICTDKNGNYTTLKNKRLKVQK